MTIQARPQTTADVARETAEAARALLTLTHDWRRWLPDASALHGAQRLSSELARSLAVLAATLDAKHMDV